MDPQQPTHQPRTLHALLVLILLGCLLAGCVMARQILVHTEQDRDRQLLVQETDSLARQIETLFTYQTDALERMADRWPLHYRQPTLWEQDAEQLLRDFDNLQAIEWVDAEHEVRWILPQQGNEPVLGFRYPDDHPNMRYLQQARDGATAILSSQFELIQGGLGLAYHIPLQRMVGDTLLFDGYLIAIFRVESLIGSLLDQLPGQPMSLSLRDGQRQLYQRRRTDSTDLMEPVKVQLQLGANDSFVLESYPDTTVFTTSRIPDLALGVGVLASLLLCYALWLALLNSRRLAALQAANRSLQSEIARRQQIEQVLQSSQSRLQLVLDITDYSYDALFILNLEPFEIVYMNRTCWASIGYSAEQLRGIMSICPDDLLPGARHWLKVLQQQIERGESRIYQQHVRTRTGKLIPLEISVRPMSRLGADYLICVGRNNHQQLEATAQLEKLTQLDGLTGLFNRRYFDSSLNAEWRRMQRQGLPLGLLMVDVDHFKLYNDTFGHLAGDDALRQISKALQMHVGREGERVCRYGGEEFAILLPGANEPQCQKVAALIHSEVRNLRIPHATGAERCVTVSIGIACALPGSRQSPEALVKAADSALYQAKHDGRDRSACAEPVG